MISSNHHERGKRGALGNFVIIITLMTRGGKEGHWGNGGCKCNCVSTAPHSLSISKFSKIEKKVRETKADTQKRLILHLKVLFSKIEKKVETNKQMHEDKREKKARQSNALRQKPTHTQTLIPHLKVTHIQRHTHTKTHTQTFTPCNYDFYLTTALGLAFTMQERDACAEKR